MNQAYQQEQAEKYKAILKVQQSLINNLWGFLSYQGRTVLPEVTSIAQNVSLDELNWEDPQQDEWHAVLFIVRNMELLLGKESQQNRETSPHQLLKEALKELRKYFLSKHTVVSKEATSHCHGQEWSEDTLLTRNIIEDCNAVVHILQQNTRLLEISEHVGSLEDLYQPLKRILNYLKNRSIKLRQSVSSASDEENRLIKELTESIPVQLDN